MNRFLALLSLLFAATTGMSHAQWVSESYSLEPGWNAIWLSQDASHDTIDNLFPVTVEEVWRWNPVASATQFTQSPAAPVQPDTQWLVWKRGFPIDTTMTALAPNAGYLVKVADAAAPFAHAIVGRPAPPRYNWKSSGLNLFGFSTKAPETNFETFLSYSAELSAGPDIFKYDGGPITANPVQIAAPLFEPVTRGRAYWVRSSQFTNYYGPLRVTITSGGLAYGDTGTALALTVKNVTGAALDATLTPVASLAPPAGQPAISGAVPLRLRGPLNPATGQFDYTDFTAATAITLAAGEERQLVFAVDRAAMAGSAGDQFASVVRITDSLDLTQIDLPVSAATTSRSGLWVGSAVTSQVDQITAAPADPTATETTVAVTTDADADAPSTFAQRIILHRADDGTVKLLQQVYIGEDSGGNTIITDSESHLDASKLATARRISTSAFPLDENVTAGGADLGLSGTATVTSVLAHTAATNPFVHTFHPDHDNKDAQFAGPLAEGVESYTVTRDIGLEFSNDPTSFGLSDLGWGSTILGGAYTETITGLRAQSIDVRGSFVLRRVSDISTLTE